MRVPLLQQVTLTGSVRGQSQNCLTAHRVSGVRQPMSQSSRRAVRNPVHAVRVYEGEYVLKCRISSMPSGKPGGIAVHSANHPKYSLAAVTMQPNLTDIMAQHN